MRLRCSVVLPSRAEATNPHDGVRIAWDSVGATDRETVLLVHGSALSKAIWRGLGYVAALAEQYRVITMDLRGHGRSAKPHERADYQLELVLADVLAVLDDAGVPQAHYLGYSFGARVGFSLGSVAPERMASFVSLAGSYRITPGSIGELFFPGYDAALASGGMDAFIAGWEGRIGRPVDPVTRMAFKANDPVALRAYFAQTETGEGVAEAALREFGVPTLLFAGTRDVRRLTDSHRAAGLMPDARVIELPGRDHGKTLVPSAPVLAEVLPFIAAHPMVPGLPTP